MSKKTICILIGQNRGGYYEDYHLGVMRLANDLGYNTVVFSSPRISMTKSDAEKQLFDLVDFSCYEGAILCSRSFYEQKSYAVALEKRLHASGIPYVVIGAKELPDSIAIYDTDDLSTVVDHIIDVHGCRNIHCLGGAMGNPRVNHFVQAMEKHGLPCGPSNLLYGGAWIDCAAKYVKDIVFGNIDMPDAVVCVFDRIAVALIKELYKNGLRVPDDLIVVGMDGESLSFSDIFSITTVPINALYHGERAMAQLHELITGERVQVREATGTLLTGDSCGCGRPARTVKQIRRRMGKHDREWLYSVYYENSELQEKLLGVKSLSELPLILDNNTYLVPDMQTFSLSLVRSAEMSECLFHSYWDYSGSSKMFRSRDILPPGCRKDEMVMNTHVLPVSFGSRFFGFITAGYHRAAMYDDHLKVFCRDISIAIEVLSRSDADVVTELPKLQPVDQQDNEHNENTIYAKREGVLSKVNLENVMYFEAFDKKVYVIMKSGRYEVKNTISELENKLLKQGYVRVSKSVLVNISKVTGVKTDDDRSLLAVFPTKQTVRVSRTYTEAFKAAMKLK